MSRGEIFEAYDAIISLEASGDFAGASKHMKRVNREAKRISRRF
jgi:hypothetical protein